jgi:hypothetical protein
MYAIYLAAISVFLIMVQIKRTPMSKGVKASDEKKPKTRSEFGNKHNHF